MLFIHLYLVLILQHQHLKLSGLELYEVIRSADHTARWFWNAVFLFVCFFK